MRTHHSLFKKYNPHDDTSTVPASFYVEHSDIHPDFLFQVKTLASQSRSTPSLSPAEQCLSGDPLRYNEFRGPHTGFPPPDHSYCPTIPLGPTAVWDYASMIPLQTDSLPDVSAPSFDQHPLEMDWTAFYLAKEELGPVDQYHKPMLDRSCPDQYDRSIEYGQANVYDEPDNDTTLQELPCSPAMRLPPMSTREHCPVNPLPTDLRLDRSFVNFDSSPRAMTCDPSLLLAETQLPDRDCNPSGYKMSEDQVHAGRRLEPFGGMASVPNATTVPGYHSHYSEMSQRYSHTASPTEDKHISDPYPLLEDIRSPSEAVAVQIEHCFRRLASQHVPAKGYPHRVHKVRRSATARTGPADHANKVTKTYRANIPHERRLAVGNPRSERIEEASVYDSISAFEAESSRDCSSLGLHDGSLRFSTGDANPQQGPSLVPDLSCRGGAWKPTALKMCTAHMARVLGCLHAISTLSCIVGKPVTVYTGNNTTHGTHRKSERVGKRRCSFQVETESLKSTMILLEIFEASLSEFTDVVPVNQQALFVASTERLKVVLTQLIEGEYLGDWERNGQGAMWGKSPRTEHDKFRRRRSRVKQLVSVAADWLRQPRQRQDDAAVHECSSSDELALLGDTTKGLELLMKHMDDLKPSMPSEQS